MGERESKRERERTNGIELIRKRKREKANGVRKSANEREKERTIGRKRERG